MEEVLIRRATKEDASEIINFNKLMAFETENLVLKEDSATAGVHRLLDEPSRGFYVVAVLADTVIGSLMITFEWSDWHNRQYYWIQSLYVRPEYRRQGIFRKLYDYVHNLASEDGAAIRLYVDENNSTAQSVYSAVGMKESHYKLYEKHFLL